MIHLQIFLKHDDKNALMRDFVFFKFPHGKNIQELLFEA